MAGIINTVGSGIYFNLEPVMYGPFLGIGTSTATQIGAQSQSTVFFENAPVDASDTIHPVTLSLPMLPGAITGTTCMPAQKVTDASNIFSINNQAVTNSGTHKVQNIGNCPTAPMILSTSHQARFYISK
ncbi:hypothetical protein [Francisella philomiragia]|uniref:Tox-PAAR-like domain-containing protein n=1 Tax=Francisella philomiragia TaxID=28110 RepID=A0AAW3DCD4_9GAMM|nr:hypothetical protein [Francisella philomiragia]KFJ43699.1 hypothetical protein DR78_1909 [Francisella philomiragia]MBK2255530.1 hypothetical protein [Francisella philomiragia]MBK2259543.1 hypothetical protein [Francisella philomiragia]MBK2266492.1 hypothetical protein [Francisella philomiragia]MBK2273814.1 hypothetical protein [Francisella philomiragia]